MLGKPSVVKDEALIKMVERQPSRSTRTEPDPSQSNISGGSHQLNHEHRHCLEVPHELNNNQYKQRLTIYKQQLANLQDARFRCRIVNGDEK